MPLKPETQRWLDACNDPSFFSKITGRAEFDSQYAKSHMSQEVYNDLVANGYIAKPEEQKHSAPAEIKIESIETTKEQPLPYVVPKTEFLQPSPYLSVGSSNLFDNSLTMFSSFDAGASSSALSATPELETRGWLLSSAPKGL